MFYVSRSAVISLLVTGCIAFISLSATAQEATAGPPEKAFRLSLEMPFMGVYHNRFTDDDGSIKHTYFQSGVGGSRAMIVPELDLPASTGLELGIGGKVSTGLVVGAKIQATVAPGKISEEYESDYYDYEGEDDLKVLTTGLGIMPYMEILPGSGRRVVPFIYFTGGFRTDIIRFKFEYDGGEETFTLLTPRGVAGIGGGLHIFLGTRCSIDIAFNGMFEMGKEKIKEEYTEDGTTVEDEEDGMDIMRIGIDASLGISAWI